MGEILELVGIPGSGKSSVSDVLGDQYGLNRLVEQPRIGRRVAGKVNHCGRGVRFFPRSFKAVLARSDGPYGASGDRIRLVANWMKVLGVTSIGARREGVTVVDQGIAQAVWSDLIRQPMGVEKALTVSLLETIARESRDLQLAVVKLDVGDGVAFGRRSQRGGQRSALEGENLDSEILKRASAAVDEALSLVEQYLPLGGAVGLVDAELPLPRVAAMVVDHLTASQW